MPKITISPRVLVQLKKEKEEVDNDIGRKWMPRRSVVQVKRDR